MESQWEVYGNNIYVGKNGYIEETRTIEVFA